MAPPDTALARTPALVSASRARSGRAEGFRRARAGAFFQGIPGRRRLLGLAGLGLGLAVLAPTGPALVAGVGVPAAAMLTRRPRRGHRALRRAIALLRRDPSAGEAALRALAHRPRLPAPIRLEAAGRVAAAALGRGQIAEAVAVLEAAGSPERAAPRRALGLGLLGELTRSLLTRLGVSRFERVAEASALVPGKPQPPANADDRADYLALLAVLELLEAHAGAPELVLEAAWRRLRELHLPVLDARFPALPVLAEAAAARRLAPARDAVVARLADRERSASARALLSGTFPELLGRLGELGHQGGEGYRSPARVPRSLVSLDSQRAPEAIRALVASHHAGTRAQRFGALAQLGAAPATVAAMTLLGSWAGPALLLGGLSVLAAQRRLRARCVVAMPFGPTPAWVREIADSPDAPLPLGDRSAPLSPEALELYLCCIRAEQALARAELDEAWAQIEWWFVHRDYRKPPKLSLEPVASALLRVAALSNHAADARALAEVLRAQPRQAKPPRRLTRRTVHGDAPRALALSTAIVYARVGAWSEAAGALAEAEGTRGIITSERDDVLHALVAQRVRAMMPSVDPRLCAIAPRTIERVRPWLVRVWPQLVPRSGD